MAEGRAEQTEGTVGVKNVGIVLDEGRCISILRLALIPLVQSQEVDIQPILTTLILDHIRSSLLGLLQLARRSQVPLSQYGQENRKAHGQHKAQGDEEKEPVGRRFMPHTLRSSHSGIRKDFAACRICTARHIPRQKVVENVQNVVQLHPSNHQLSAQGKLAQKSEGKMKYFEQNILRTELSSKI